PSGAYVPEFHAAEAEAAPAPPIPIVSHSRPGPWLIGAAGLAFAVFLGIAWLVLRPSTTALDQFWAPVLEGKSPTLVCAAFVPVWNLDRDPNATGPPRPEDYVPLTDQFVGGGDLIATSRLTAMLTRLRHPY